jgi:hypothetical protein
MQERSHKGKPLKTFQLLVTLALPFALTAPPYPLLSFDTFPIPIRYLSAMTFVSCGPIVFASTL